MHREPRAGKRSADREDVEFVQRYAGLLSVRERRVRTTKALTQLAVKQCLWLQFLRMLFICASRLRKLHGISLMFDVCRIG